MIAWGAVVGLLLLMGWGMLTRIETAPLLVVPFVLWLLLLRLRHGAVWGLLLVISTYAAIYYIDIFMVLRDLDLLPFAILFGITPFLMLLDPPLRWPHDRLLDGAATPLFASDADRRRDFLHWWSIQDAEQRQRVWMRLLPEERRWALDEMPPDIRVIYRHIEQAHAAGHDVRYIGGGAK
jgi:hypothetical protein